MLALASPILLLGQCTIDAENTPAYTFGRPAVASMASAAAQTSPIEKEFLAVPTAASARASLKHITSRPHVAGTPGDLAMAQFVHDQIKAAGIDSVHIDPQKVLLNYPIDRSLDLVDTSGRVILRPPLAEAILPSDPTSDTWWRNHTFNGYGPSGSVEAPIVYANFGFPEDFAALKSAGVDVRGKVALMRYGKCFRGLKAMNAEQAGAVAALIYSDPEQDGFAKGTVYPDGPWRPPSSVQRGSIQFISLCPGDPARAYLPAGAQEELCGYNLSQLVPSIPVLPLSYEDAAPLLRSLGGAEAPPDFRGALNLTYRLGPSSDGVRARLMINNTFARTPVWNVIATIPGELPPEQDQPVLLGNHRDAWVYGAADPNSGTSQLLEVAKGLGALLAKGWRPRRTIVLCSWSGEEYGLLGSTAWSEVNADSALLRRAVAYLNVDTGVSGRHFRAQGTPSLGRVLAGVLGAVADPAQPAGSGATLADAWDDGDLFALGSGSDYTAFIDHLGIASLDMAFAPNGTYGLRLLRVDGQRRRPRLRLPRRDGAGVGPHGAPPRGHRRLLLRRNPLRRLLLRRLLLRRHRRRRRRGGRQRRTDAAADELHSASGGDPLVRGSCKAARHRRPRRLHGARRGHRLVRHGRAPRHEGGARGADGEPARRRHRRHHLAGRRGGGRCGARRAAGVHGAPVPLGRRAARPQVLQARASSARAVHGVRAQDAARCLRRRRRRRLDDGQRAGGDCRRAHRGGRQVSAGGAGRGGVKRPRWAALARPPRVKVVC